MDRTPTSPFHKIEMRVPKKENGYEAVQQNNVTCFGIRACARGPFSLHGRTAKAQSITSGTTVNSQVYLFCDFFISSACNLSTLSSDGTTFNLFVIPAGQTLVLTDMECSIQTCTAGEIGTCGLKDQLAAVSSTGQILGDKIIIVQAGSPSGTGKTAVVSLHLTTGIQLTFIPTVISNSVATPAHANVITFQGYLIPTPTTGS